MEKSKNVIETVKIVFATILVCSILAGGIFLNIRSKLIKYYRTDDFTITYEGYVSSHSGGTVKVVWVDNDGNEHICNDARLLDAMFRNKFDTDSDENYIVYDSDFYLSECHITHDNAVALGLIRDNTIKFVSNK